MKPKTVVILRGLPGSGKTSFSDLLDPHHYISMDLFWTKDGSTYNFDFSRIREAIEWAHQLFIAALDDVSAGACELVVVDNVSYARQHYQFFVDEAETRGCRVHIAHVERELDECIASTVHGVPAAKIRQMAEKWEKI